MSAKHIDALDERKEDVSVHLEHRDLGGMPDCLQALSPEEYIKVGRKATLKMDLVLLPCLMAMYILYVESIEDHSPLLVNT